MPDEIQLHQQRPIVHSGTLREAVEEARRVKWIVVSPVVLMCDDRGQSNFDIFGGWSGGQVNLSRMYPGVIKGWHMHDRQTDFMFCTEGAIKVAVFDATSGAITSVVLNDRAPALVVIPPGLWHGVTVLGTSPATMLYYCTERYDPSDPDEHRAPWDMVGTEIWETSPR